MAEDEATLALMKEAFSCLGPEASYFYSGHHLAQSGQWVDVNTGEPQLWQPWREGEPRADLHCSDFYLQRDGLDSTPCSVEETPICQLRPNSPQLHLTGLCPHSRADRFYIIEDSTSLFGLTGTSIIFSQGRWQIVLTVDHQQIIAVLNSSVDFPLGKHSWYFQEGNCQDPGETFRSLNLHLEVPQPGQFCCDSGHCLDSDLVCNNYPDCQDGSDEANCSIVKLPLFGYNNNLPVIEIMEGTDSFLTLNSTFTLLDVFDISEEESLFDIKFSLHLTWFDKNLQFTFLKNLEKKNVLSPSAIKDIWRPQVLFEDIKMESSNENEKYFVTKTDSASMAEDGITEIYEGKTNPLNYVMRSRVIFICSFDSSNYPFGRQNCSLKFYLKGVANDLCELRPTFVNRGPLRFGQYVVEQWRTEATEDGEAGNKFVLVTVILTRKFSSIFLATYLPSILMNMINQATNYISGDTKYDLVYTIKYCSNTSLFFVI